MTTPPTPESVLQEWDRYTIDQLGPAQAPRRVALRQAIAERADLTEARDLAVHVLREVEAERDEARSMLATAEGLHDAWQAERDQALARVAVLRKALNEIYEDGNFISRFAIVARKALETEDQAASALLAERDALKAKLTVAEEALEFYAARRCERCAGITARNALDVIGAMP